MVERLFKGIGRKEYFRIHHWLKDIYGKATKCENLDCKKRSTNYEWALKKGYTYDYEKNNFWMLCISCHRSYDTTEYQRKASSKRLKGKIAWNKGIPMNDAQKEKLRKINTGKKLSEDHKQKIRDGAIKAGSGKWMKGRKPWNKGKTYSTEQKKNIVKSQRLRRLNEMQSGDIDY